LNYQYNYNKTYVKHPFNKYYVCRKKTLGIKCKATITVDTTCTTIINKVGNHNHPAIKELDLLVKDKIQEIKAKTTNNQSIKSLWEDSVKY
jgi:hypothetical protein